MRLSLPNAMVIIVAGIILTLLLMGSLPGTAKAAGGEQNSQVEPTPTKSTSFTPAPAPPKSTFFVPADALQPEPPDSQLSHWEREIATHALQTRILEDAIENVPRSIYPYWTEAEVELYRKLALDQAAEDRLLERACRLFSVRYFELEPGKRLGAPAECAGFRFAFDELYN